MPVVCVVGCLSPVLPVLTPVTTGPLCVVTGIFGMVRTIVSVTGVSTLTSIGCGASITVGAGTRLPLKIDQLPFVLPFTS